jgi:hypothetical protein
MAFDIKAALTQLKNEMEEIAGRWNGDNSGLAEDRAHCALEIIKQVEGLEKLLDEMNNY